MIIGYAAQQLINGLQVAAFYSLLSVSYVLIHAITRRINFAFGALSILAGYTFINATQWVMLDWPGATLSAVVAAALIAIPHTAFAGVATEALVVRPVVRESSLAVLVTTLGLSVVLEELTRLANDSRERWLSPMFSDPYVIGPASSPFNVYITPVQLAVIVIAFAMASGLVVFIARSEFGRHWRAASQDLRMAELCGIDIGRTLRLTYLIAIAFAATAGVLVALLYGVASHSGGFVIGLKTLFIAVVGGLGSIPGTFAAAILLAFFETVWSASAGPEYRDAAAFLLLTLLMIAFPRGIFDRESSTEPV
jgi:branched-chain amino acid transport system permease protein